MDAPQPERQRQQDEQQEQPRREQQQPRDTQQHEQQRQQDEQREQQQQREEEQQNDAPQQQEQQDMQQEQPQEPSGGDAQATDGTISQQDTSSVCLAPAPLRKVQPPIVQTAFIHFVATKTLKEDQSDEDFFIEKDTSGPRLEGDKAKYTTILSSVHVGSFPNARALLHEIFFHGGLEEIKYFILFVAEQAEGRWKPAIDNSKYFGHTNITIEYTVDTKHGPEATDIMDVAAGGMLLRRLDQELMRGGKRQSYNLADALTVLQPYFGPGQ